MLPLSFSVAVWEWVSLAPPFTSESVFSSGGLAPDPLFIFRSLNGWCGFLPLFSVWLIGTGGVEARTASQASSATWMEDARDVLLCPQHQDGFCGLASGKLVCKDSSFRD